MKTLVIIIALTFPGLLMADLTVDDFKVLKQEVMEVNKANSKVSSLLFNQNLTEEQFQLLKDSVDRLKKSVDKMEKTINKQKVFTDQSWYWDVQKGVYWKQLPDGSLETKPVIQSQFLQNVISGQNVSC